MSSLPAPLSILRKIAGRNGRARTEELFWRSAEGRRYYEEITDQDSDRDEYVFHDSFPYHVTVRKSLAKRG